MILNEVIINTERKISKLKEERPEKYMINLVNTLQKLFFTILNDKTEQEVVMADERQGFQKNRSTLKETFAIKQTEKKFIEHGK